MDRSGDQLPAWHLQSPDPARAGGFRHSAERVESKLSRTTEMSDRYRGWGALGQAPCHHNWPRSTYGRLDVEPASASQLKKTEAVAQIGWLDARCYLGLLRAYLVPNPALSEKGARSKTITGVSKPLRGTSPRGDAM